MFGRFIFYCTLRMGIVGKRERDDAGKKATAFHFHAKLSVGMSTGNEGGGVTKKCLLSLPNSNLVVNSNGKAM